MMTIPASAAALGRALTSASLRRNASVLLGVSSVLEGGRRTFCEDESMFSKIVKKNKSGSFDWNATLDGIASEIGGKVQGAVDSGIPTQLSYGFVCGYCSGLALKKAGRIAAVVFGMGFVALQSLQYTGYIQVDHGKLKKDMENFLDLDKDGDLDQDDAKLAYNKIFKVMSYNLPAGSGFGVGFIGGLRSG